MPSEMSSENVHCENTPSQIYRKFYLQNWKFSEKKNMIFFKFLLKTYIVGTH